MRTIKYIVLALALTMLLVVISTGVAAHSRESRVRQVQPGMPKSEVELLLGRGYPDVMSPACERCPPQHTQFAYEGNASLWFGRLEDMLVVGYVNDVVCDTTRVGL